ncbi:MAG: hypothetical protein WBO24_12055 [Nitrospirales bacterium]
MTVYKNIHNTKILTGFILAASGLVIFTGGLLISRAEESPPADPSRDRPVMESAPTPQGAEDQPSGDIQERGILRKMPGLTKPQLGRTPQLLMPGVAPNTPAFSTLPGEFSIRTVLKKTPLTFPGGGHHTINAVVTAPSGIGPDQKIQLAQVQPNFTTILTRGGYYLSAVTGRTPEYSDYTQPLQTELRTPDRDTALFRIEHPNASWFTIQTFDGHFLTAVGGGGKATDAFHTDATKALDWEYFVVSKCGDLGSGYAYEIKGLGFNNELGHTQGGGLGTFRLVRQANGSYALQYPNSNHYVTAEGGGGLASGIVLQSNRTQVQAWEQFKFVDQGDCTYTIQTLSGFYIGYGHRTLKSGKLDGETLMSTRISDPNGAPSINYTAKFELIMLGL